MQLIEYQKHIYIKLFLNVTNVTNVTNEWRTHIHLVKILMVAMLAIMLEKWYHLIVVALGTSVICIRLTQYQYQHQFIDFRIFSRPKSSQSIHQLQQKKLDFHHRQ